MKSKPQPHLYAGALPSYVARIGMPDKQVLNGAFIWPEFCQKALEIDPAWLWLALRAYPTQPLDQPLTLGADGRNPRWITGDYKNLSYRGNPIPRDKMWFQLHYAEGLRRYRYPGWCWIIACATYAVEHSEPMRLYAERLNAWLATMGETPHNHFIVTKYADKNDNISPHHDHDDDFAPNTYFIAVKLGAARDFAFHLPGNPKPFLVRELAAGSAVFVKCRAPDAANSLIQHSVPRMTRDVGVSGSIVSRNIETVFPWDKVRQEIEKRRAKP